MATNTSSMCEPCCERRKQMEAVKWCSDCEESFCTECTACHLSMKATKMHHVVDLKVAHSYWSSHCFEYKYCDLHEGVSFEYFCRDHQALCCRECMISELHRSCRKISTIDAASKLVKTTKQFKEVEDELEHILETLTNITTDRQENAADIITHVKAVKDSVMNMKSKMIQRLEVIEQIVLEDLDRVQKEAVGKLKNETQQTETEKEVVKVYKNQINFIKKHGSDRQTFLFTHKLRGSLHDLKDQLVSKIARLRAVSIKHTMPDETLSKLSLGAVFMQESPCTEKFKLHIEDFKLYQNFTLCHKIDLNLIDKKAFITGMAVSGDKIFLCNCDWNHHTPRVIVCSKNGEFLSGIDVNGAPWDIAVIPGENMAVVVLSNINAIQFLDTKNLTSDKEIKMVGNDEKRGIAATKDRIFIGGTDKLIYVLDLNGSLLSTIFVNGEKFYYLLSISNGDLVYSDFCSIHRIKLDGTEVYSYKSSELRNPKKIAADQLGNLYIAGKDSHNIHRLTPDGTLLEIVLQEDATLHHPRVVCFDTDSHKLFVSNHSGKELLIFNCT